MFPAAAAPTAGASTIAVAMQRRRRLAVGARDGDHRAGTAGTGLLPPVGQLELAAHRHARLGGHREERVALGEPGLGVTSSTPATSAASDAPVGASTSSTPSSAALARRVGDPVVGHGDPPAAGHQRPGGGDAGDGQAVDERGRGHATPIWRAKSA